MAKVPVKLSAEDFENHLGRHPESDEIDENGMVTLLISVMPNYKGDDETVLFEIGQVLKLPIERWSIDWDNVDWSPRTRLP